MNNAMIPIIAFNYGKQDKKRVNDSIKYGLIYTVSILCAGIIILQILQNRYSEYSRLQNRQPNLQCLQLELSHPDLYLSVVTLRIREFSGTRQRCAFADTFACTTYCCSSAPCIHFSCFDFASSIIWIAFPIGEAVAFIVALIFMANIRRKKINPIKNGV